MGKTKGGTMSWINRWLNNKTIDKLMEQVRTEKHRADMFEKAYKESLETIRKLRKEKKPRKKLIGERATRTIVSTEESEAMYNLWKKGKTMLEVANYFKRSESCVSKHIRKHYEENEDGQQMGNLSTRKDRTSKEEK